MAFIIKIYAHAAVKVLRIVLQVIQETLIYKNRVKKRKRDRFTNVNKDGAAKVIKPYWKKPKLSHFSFVKTKVSGKCHHYTEIKRKNVL